MSGVRYQTAKELARDPERQSFNVDLDLSIEADIARRLAGESLPFPNGLANLEMQQARMMDFTADGERPSRVVVLIRGRTLVGHPEVLPLAAAKIRGLVHARGKR